MTNAHDASGDRHSRRDAAEAEAGPVGATRRAVVHLTRSARRVKLPLNER